MIEKNWHRTEKAVFYYSRVKKKGLAVHSILKSLSSNHFKGLSLTNKWYDFSFIWRAITILDCNFYYLSDCNTSYPIIIIFTVTLLSLTVIMNLQYYQWQCTTNDSTWELRHDEWLQFDRNVIVNICSALGVFYH